MLVEVYMFIKCYKYTWNDIMYNWCLTIKYFKRQGFLRWVLIMEHVFLIFIYVLYISTLYSSSPNPLYPLHFPCFLISRLRNLKQEQMDIFKYGNWKRALWYSFFFSGQTSQASCNDKKQKTKTSDYACVHEQDSW